WAPSGTTIIKTLKKHFVASKVSLLQALRCCCHARSLFTTELIDRLFCLSRERRQSHTIDCNNGKHAAHRVVPLHGPKYVKLCNTSRSYCIEPVLSQCAV